MFLMEGWYDCLWLYIYSVVYPVNNNRGGVNCFPTGYFVFYLFIEWLFELYVGGVSYLAFLKYHEAFAPSLG